MENVDAAAASPTVYEVHSSVGANSVSTEMIPVPCVLSGCTNEFLERDKMQEEILSDSSSDASQVADESLITAKLTVTCEENVKHFSRICNEGNFEHLIGKKNNDRTVLKSESTANINANAISITSLPDDKNDQSSQIINNVYKIPTVIDDLKHDNLEVSTIITILPKTSMPLQSDSADALNDANEIKSTNSPRHSHKTSIDTEINFTAHFIGSSSDPNINSTCQQDFDYPIILDKDMLVSKSLEILPIVASECVVETDYPLHEICNSSSDLPFVSDNKEEKDLSIRENMCDYIQSSAEYACSTKTFSDAENSDCGLVNEENSVLHVEAINKKERHSMTCDETIRRRSSRIAEKKHLRSQKDATNRPKVEQDKDIKDANNCRSSEKNIPDHHVQLITKNGYCEKENIEEKHKCVKKASEKDHIIKTQQGSSKFEKHEIAKPICCKREGKLDNSCVKSISKTESFKSSKNDKTSVDKTTFRYKSKCQDCLQIGSKNGHSKKNILKEEHCFPVCSTGRQRRRRSQSASEKYSESHDSSVKQNCDTSKSNIDSCEGCFSPEQEDKEKKAEDLQKLIIPNKKDSEDQNISKPEKVKSRWRRNSELEHSGLSNTSCISLDIFDSISLDILKQKENLSPICEEQGTSIESTRKTDEPKEKPPQYGMTEDNIYLFERKRSKSKKEVRRMVCDCSLTKEEKEQKILGCDGDCLNRLLMIECGSRCATGDSCSNKRFQKKQFAKTEPFKTEKKGWGLRVLEDVAAGKFVMEYVGEVLNPQDFKQRVKQYAREKYSHYYFMALRRNEIIDATNKGNLSRFINHSCDPNCETQKWTVNGELRIGFFTRQDVKAGDELTFDYQFQRYGKEAQKCYCESECCRGYIGEDKQISLDSYSSSKNTNRRKKTGGEDLTLEEKIEKLSVIRGLRNREETLVLARLMVIAEDSRTRHRLLDIILNTTELPCLRLFLDYQGLPLIWSWMVDAADSKLRTKLLQVLAILPVPNKTMLMDSKVINVVQKWWLTLSVKKTDFMKENEITETEQSSDSPSGANTPCGTEEIQDPPLKKIKLNENSDGETDSSCLRLREMENITFTSCAATGMHVSTSATQPAEIRKNENRLNQFVENGNILADKSSNSSSANLGTKNIPSDCLKTAEVISKSDEDSGDTMDEDEDKKYDTEVSNLASKLLESWSGLKEVFRIPRLEQQKRREDEDAVDNQHHEKECGLHRDSSKDCFGLKSKDKDRDFPESEQNIVKDKKHKDKCREKGKEYDCQVEKCSLDSLEWRDDRKHFKPNRKSWPNMNVELPVRPRKALLPTPPRLTKEERRQRFALEVQQRDEQEALRRQQVEQSCTEGYQTGGQLNYTTYNQYYDRSQYDSNYNSNHYNSSYDPNNHYIQQVPSDCQTTLSSNSLPPNVGLSNEQKPALLPTRTALLPTPTFVEPGVQPVNLSVLPTQYSDHSAPLAYPPPPGILFQPAPTQAPFLSAPPPALGQPTTTLNPPPANSGLPPATASLPRITILPHTPLSSAVQNLNHASSASVTTCASVSSSSAKTDSFNSSSSVSNATSSSPLSAVSAQTSVPVAPGYLSNPAQFGNSQNRPMYFVHSTNTTSVVNVREQIAIQRTIPVVQTNPSVLESGCSSPVIKVANVKLPPNWKTARDPEGNIYYYHAITRQTQWDPPSLEENEEMDLGTPTFDEPKLSKKKSTTTAAADTSSEVAKKIKELFRTKMSSFIVQCLNPYRKPDCSVGRITSSDDFKHLARKLTHFVMSKELKHCKNVEDLECNENVKLKAKDFTQKYMAKQGIIYRKEKESSGKCN